MRIGMATGRGSLRIGEKSLPPTGMRMETGTGVEINRRAGMETRTGVNFHPIPVPASPLWEIFPSPFSLFRSRLEKKSHPCFFLLNCSWIVLCIVKIMLYKLIKF